MKEEVTFPTQVFLDISHYFLSIAEPHAPIKQKTIIL